MRVIQLTLLFFLAFSMTTFAQSTLKRNIELNEPMQKEIASEVGPIYEDDAQADAPMFEPSPVVGFRQDFEVTIGTTVYDLQSNSGVCNRMFKDGDNLYGVWTMGFSDSDGYSDRGTGYNAFDGAAWGDQPELRIEDGVRTGWPNHTRTADGTEFSVAHVFTEGEYRMHYARRAAGETDWTEADIPTETPLGVLWPRMAAGGPDGNTIHAIGIATPTFLAGGVVYEGVDGHILYYRSPDAGETWDVVDFIIPGLDSTQHANVSADAYNIDVRGNTVAVAVFDQLSDVVVYKSTDNGDTWTKTIAHDFPLDTYAIDDGYSFEDLPPYDPAQPDSLAIFTTDDAGALIIDNNDQVHVFFGQMYVLDSDTTDGNFNFFPAISGVGYWNESHGPDSIRTIADIIDVNMNDTLDIEATANIATFFLSLSSMPSAGIDEAGNIYLAYSGVMETEEFLNIEDQQHYRHILMVASMDDGDTWGSINDAGDFEEGLVFDVINGEVIIDEELVPFIEGVFPHVAKTVDDRVHLIYQQDFQPGLSVRGDNDAPVTNLINYVGVEVDQLVLPPSNTQETVEAEYFALQTLPNPASTDLFVQFELDANESYTLDLYSITGQKVSNLLQATADSRLIQETIDVSELPKGIYLLRLQAENKLATSKLVVK